MKKPEKPGVNYCGYLLNEKAMETYRSRVSRGETPVVVMEKRCKMEKRVGRRFCPQHEMVEFVDREKKNQSEGVHKGEEHKGEEHKGEEHKGEELPEHLADRVLCPYPPAHYVIKTKLQNHMARCNFRPLAEDFFHHNLHLDPPSSLQAAPESSSLKPLLDSPAAKTPLLKSVPLSQLLGLIERVEKVAAQLQTEEPMIERITSHKRMEAEIKEGTEKTVKHLAQESSLLGNMELVGLLNPKFCFLEFGAGRGGLTRAIHVGLDDPTNQATFLLVDRAGSRKKVDSKLKASADHVSRIRIDIKDLDLTKVKQAREKPLVAVGKHLCGGGTDVSLRCAIHFCQHEKAQGRSDDPVKGFVIALCCHHRCTWNSYVNKPYIEALGFSEKDFDIIAKLSTWTICGRRKDPDEEGNGSEEGDEDDHDAGDEEPEEEVGAEEEEEVGEAEAREEGQEPKAKRPRLEATHFSGLTYAHRLRIGKASKFVLNVGRKRFLAEQGFQPELVLFTRHSLENVALLATTKDEVKSSSSSSSQQRGLSG